VYFVCTCALHSGQCYKWFLKTVKSMMINTHNQSIVIVVVVISVCLGKQTAVCAHIQKNCLQVF